MLEKSLNTLNKYTPKLLKLVRFPHNILNSPCALVTNSVTDDRELQELMDDMVKTLTHFRAAGLAANQVGVPVRVIVVQDKDLTPIKMVNPVIVDKTTATQFETEGCLSVPGMAFRVTRPSRILVKYIDEYGAFQERGFDGLLARAISHEVEHLDGLTFFDTVGKVQKDALLRKYNIFLRKFKKMAGLDSVYL